MPGTTTNAKEKGAVLNRPFINTDSVHHDPNGSNTKGVMHGLVVTRHDVEPVQSLPAGDLVVPGLRRTLVIVTGAIPARTTTPVIGTPTTAITNFSIEDALNVLQ